MPTDRRVPVVVAWDDFVALSHKAGSAR